MDTLKYFSQNVVTDVTTVKFVEGWIIAGIGGCIHVFETQSGNFITKEEIFNGQRVHNVFPGRRKNVAVIGGRMVQIFGIEKTDPFTISKQTAWSTNDWIQYLQWLDCGNVAIITAHNEVSLWNSQTAENLRNIYCEAKSILYCALLSRSSWDELVVFAGTVFKQVLVWIPANLERDTEDSPVLQALKGHDGVIFSVSYDSYAQRICTTSDDRSVRLWAVDMQLSEDNSHVTQWKEAKITLLHTMYGHTARVWRNIIIDNVAISVGEDSRLCVWNMDGTLQKVWRTHQNGNVWSLDCSKEENLIVTGGGDGGINLWPLHVDNLVPISLAYDENLCSQNSTSMKRQYQTFPRRIGLTSRGNVVAVTDSGCLLYCTVLNGAQGEWRLVYQDEKFASYCLLEMSPCRQYIALANMDGCILIFKENSSLQEEVLILNIEEKAVKGRIFSLHWLSSEILLTCGPDGALEMWTLGTPHQLEKVYEFELPKSKERWISAAALKETFVVCGDRCGSVHLFKANGDHSKSIQCPCQSFYKIHGRLGVSSLVWHGNYLYSTGRDGILRKYLLFENESKLECLNADKLSLEWPATTSFSVFGLLVLGFRSVNFSMWSHEERRTLLTIPCGGGHRSWDWTLEGHEFTFIFLKDKMIHLYTCVINKLVKPILQSGFHFKGINCIRQVPLLKEDSEYHLLISASEDTTIRVAAVGPCNDLKTMAVLHSHISSVRALTVCPLRKSTLVFSGGGRAQLKVWKLSIQDKKEFMPQVTCQELYSHMLKDPSKINKKPWLTAELSVDPETRYMDLSAVSLHIQDAASVSQQRQTLVLVVAGCSDGFFRVFGFDTLLSELKLVGKYSFHGRCILKVTLLQTESLKYVAFTMSTDGKVAMWDLTSCVEGLVDPLKEGCDNKCEEASTSKCDTNESAIADDLKPFSVVKIHQSGINSFDLVRLYGDTYLFATGGDDNALVLSVIQIISPTSEEEMEAEIVLQWKDIHAHASQITGLKIEHNILISTAIDQRITLWDWNCDLENKIMSASIKAKYCSTVPDIQGLVAWNLRSVITACVYGKGLEIVNFQLNQEAS